MNIGLQAIIETQIDKASAQREGQKLQRELEEYATLKPHIDAEDMAREVADKTRRDPLTVQVDTDSLADQLESFEDSRKNPFSERSGGLTASLSRDNPANPLADLSGAGGDLVPVTGGGAVATTGTRRSAPAVTGGGGGSPATGGQDLFGGAMDAVPVEVVNGPLSVIPDASISTGGAGGMGGGMGGGPMDIGPAQPVDGPGLLGGIAGQVAADSAADMMGSVVNNGLGAGAGAGAAGGMMGNIAQTAGRATGKASAVGGAIAGGGGVAGLSKLAGLVGPAGLAVAASGVVFMGMAKGIQALADKAPTLGKGMDMLGQAWNLLWRPLGEELGGVILPMASALLEFTADFNKIYEDGGLAVALGWGAKEIGEAIYNYFGSKIGGIFSGDKNKAVQGGASMGTLAGGAIGMALGGPVGMVIGALIGNLTGQLVGHVVTAVQNTDWGKVAGAVADGAVGAVVDGFEALDGAVDSVVAWFADIIDIDIDFSPLYSLMRDAVGVVTDVLDKVASAYQKLDEKVAGVVAWFEEITGIDFPDFSPLDTLASSASDVSDYFDELANMDAEQIVKKVFNDAKDGFVASLGEITDVLGTVDTKFDGLVTWVEDITGINFPDFSPLQALIEHVKNFRDNIKNFDIGSVIPSKKEFKAQLTNMFPTANEFKNAFFGILPSNITLSDLINAWKGGDNSSGAGPTYSGGNQHVGNTERPGGSVSTGSPSDGGNGFSGGGAVGGGSGGASFGNVVTLASGGLVTGPTPAIVGEGGESEAVVPLSQWESMVRESVSLEVTADDIGKQQVPDAVRFGTTPGTFTGPTGGVSGGIGSPGGTDADGDRIEMDPETQAVLEDVRNALQTIEREIRKGGGETVIKADGRKLAAVTEDARDRFLSSREVTK